MPKDAKVARFEQVALPHLDAAYNLARWLTRDASDAEDVVQDAMLRALQYFASYDGRNARAWLLAIVRNTSLTWLQRNRPPQVHAAAGDLDEELPVDPLRPPDPTPEDAVARGETRQHLSDLVAELPIEFREVLILREIEDCSYREIANIAGIPIGTVMSRLARARRMLQVRWRDRHPGEDDHAL